VKVLASNQNLSIQVGANDGETISIQLQKINSKTLGLDSFDITGGSIQHENLGKTPVENGDTVSVKFDVSDLNDVTDSTSATTSKHGDVYALKDGSGYVALADNGKYYTLDTSDASGLTYDSTTAVDADTVDMSGGPVDSIVADVAVDTDTNMDSAALTAVNGADGKPTGEYILDNGDGTYNKVSIAADGTATKGDAVSVDPLKALDDALSDVDSLRSNLGAYQNRFESAIDNLNTTTTNLSAARSRIEDADYAVEVSNMTRAQILQQAGTAVLSQANQVPQSVLSLLR
jgi:flagellin